MDYRNNAYGIGQRRQPNDATSFAPIRGGGGSGGGAIDDNFRGSQSMNYARSDSFSNSNNFNYGNNNNSSNSMGFNNNSNNNNNSGQRYADIDNKFGGSVQSNNYNNRSSNNLNSNYNNSNSDIQRYGNNNNNRGGDSFNAGPSKSNFDSVLRRQSYQQQQQTPSSSNFLGRSSDQRFPLSGSSGGGGGGGYSAGSSGSGGGGYSGGSNIGYSGGAGSGVGGGGSRGVDNYRNQSQQLQQNQQSSLSSNLSLGRSNNDFNYNNSGNNNNNHDNNSQRFYNNNDRNDTFRRSDNFNENFRSGSNFNKNNIGNSNNNQNNINERNEQFGRSNSAANFGFNDRSGFDNFRGPQQQQQHQQHQPNNNQKPIQPYFNNNSNNNGPQNISGNLQPYRGPNNNNNNGPTGQALAAITETVSALISNNSNWQVGKNNYTFNQGNANAGGFRNVPGRRNFNNAGPNAVGPGGNWGNNNISNSNKPQQQQVPNQGPGKAFVNRKAPNGGGNSGGVGGANRVQNQPRQNVNNQIANKKVNANVNNNNNANKQQQKTNQPVARNVNGGGPKPKAVVPSKTNAAAPAAASAAAPAPASKAAAAAAQNTQAKANGPSKPKPVVIKKEPAPAQANAKAGQKRALEAPAVVPTKADIKRRKLAIKRGFLIGGYKLPYYNSLKVALPQPEDNSYAVIFFEQLLNYSTSGEELDDEAAAIYEEDTEGKNAGRMLVKRIRKRLHHEWTQMEETKKYATWKTWWTDFKWCEQAIQEKLLTFGSINVRDCFLPDLPRLTTEQVVDVIIKQAQFGLEKNSDNYFNNMKSILTLMNQTFLENLKMPNTERVQDIIRGVPNAFWTYKMRSMVFLWAQYLKISKTSSPSTETGAKELQAIARDWKNPLFHWIAKQAFDELKAISELEWPEHKQLYGTLESTEPINTTPAETTETAAPAPDTTAEPAPAVATTTAT